MSYVRAKQSFKDAQRSIKASQDVVSLALVEGLLQLTQSLEKHIAELHSEIVVVRKEVEGKGARTPPPASRKRR
ncbi:MAG: hypothetical protein NFCOHLIN_03234 [Gammaproteobacteria bacterium]|nr:hypothetical protein [Gammaproteobacteria bacterium]